MFTNIYLNRLRNGEFMQFHKQTLAFVQEANPEKLAVLAQYDALDKEWKELENLFKKDVGSSLTKKIEESDLHRDNMIIGIRTIFQANTYHFEPKIAAAATMLLHSVDKYGSSLARKNYQEESAIISGLLKDWQEDEEAIQALQKVGASKWKEELQKANESFELLYRQRTVDLTNLPEGSFASLKAPVIEAYNALTAHLVAHATLASDKAPYNTLIDLLNTHIKQYQDLINKRKKGASEPVGV
ncbi:MAG: DUF6261 family protein [Reichenbachiella sp.]